jgi:hypothetical protein
VTNEFEMFRDDAREAERRDDELEHIYPHRRYVSFRDPADHAPAVDLESFAGPSGVGAGNKIPRRNFPNDQLPAAPVSPPSSSCQAARGTAGLNESEAA